MTTSPDFKQSSLPVTQTELLHRITSRICRSLELPEILSTTVTEVRAFLGMHRVMMYQFHRDGSGKVITEAIAGNALPSLLGLNFPATDIPQERRNLFLKARQRSIVNATHNLIGVSSLDCVETGKPLETPQVVYRAADGCHLQYLRAMGVEASLVMPIVYKPIHSPDAELVLWGLLVAHHASTRSISEQELQTLQQVVDQVAIAIAQATLLEQTRAQAKREARINQVANLLHVLPDIQLQTALEKTVEALRGSGGRLYLTPKHSQQAAELFVCGTQPETVKQQAGTALEQYYWWQQRMKVTSAHTHSVTPIASEWERPHAISDLYETTEAQEIAPAFQDTSIRSVLIIPLSYMQQPLGCLTIFRNEFTVETLWAGQIEPTENAPRVPRESFEAWREVKKQQILPWQPEDLEMAQALGQQFSRAIQQYYLYQQVHTLNASLEEQVQARTSQLQKSWKLDSVLRQVTNQIRRTLDVQTILQTIVQEVLALLDTDRVVIYQFTRLFQGEVVVEAIAGDWQPLLHKQYEDECFPRGHAQLYQGGRIRAIDDVANSNLSPCHIQFLLDIQVQANLVVPIRSTNDLWGLLIAHECREPRKWRTTEIDLLQQLADQAVIAIQQGELYEQSQRTAQEAVAQAQKLELALEELKRTQTQLIQSEKMSSLGQLVAGVAHEINNPVNFIYGNLAHASEYTQDILKLLHLYQTHYPDPNPEIAQEAEEVDLDFVATDLPKLLNSMKVGADRIQRIVASLRTFSRMDEAEYKAVNIHEGIDSTLMILQNRLKDRPGHPAIEVVKEYGDLPLVECYGGQLNQVFMNILSNAIDALEERDQARSLEEAKQSPSKIFIHTELTNTQSIKIRIIDNGTGMSEETKARLFNPFFTTKPVGKGTGLGMSISYQIVTEKHGGSLSCHSKVGEGTEFAIEIPLRHS